MFKRVIFPLLIVLVIFAALGLWRANFFYGNDIASSIYNQQGTGPGSPNNNGQDPVNTTDPALPRTLLLKVPFTPQAPTANWDELHNEACEEASSLMAGLY